MSVTENRDELVFGAMQELWQSRAWKIVCEELDKQHRQLYAKLLEVREDQDKPVYTADQLYKRELHYIERLRNLPVSLVKTTTTYVQDMSNKL
jgi:hypothetical protein